MVEEVVSSPFLYIFKNSYHPFSFLSIPLPFGVTLHAFSCCVLPLARAGKTGEDSILLFFSGLFLIRSGRYYLN
jgi:hypothetical protein